ncbi:MAG TPA: TonB-dependent receptor [Candidatus Acidoferrales bacterium]|nr:TonB-dependent receptor [Candidatus Acidoferrales bacterium]
MSTFLGLQCLRSKRGFQALGLALGLLLFCVPAYPQLNYGSINGTITDASGAVIVGATVTITDVDRGVSRTLITDSAGQYFAPSLTPGSYSVRVEFTGFQSLNRTSVSVGVGQAVRVDLSMQPGSQSQTVTVTEAVPLVDTTNEVLSSTVESTQLAELPINGQLYTKVLEFQPGIHGNPGGNSPNYQTNGASGQGNYFLLDGVENSNIFVNSGPLIGAATSTDELTILPQDAVQEVNVMTNPPAEFGWFQGAVVNVGLKSGTNAIHGSGYGFGRNNSLDAYDPYLGGSPAPKQDDNFKQFGGSLGGPVKKDKLFYFGAFDLMRYTVGTAGTATVPTVNGGAGVDDPTHSVPLAIQDLINNQDILPSQLSLNLSDCTVAGAAPTAVATCGTKGVFRNNSLRTNNLGVPGDSAGHSNNVIGRVDYHLNDRNSINGEYFFGQAITSTPNVGEPSFWNNLNLSRTQMMRAVWIDTPNTNWVNEVRFGYNRYNLADGNAECAGGNYSTGNVGQPNYAALGFNSGANPPSPFCGFPAVNFTQSGFPSFGALSFFISDQGVFQYTYTAYDNASYTHGKHNFRFGFEFHHSKFRGIGAPGFLDGVLNFNGGVAFDGSTDLEDFLAGAIGGGNQILVNPQQELTSLGFNREAFYFSDDFRLNSRVTVNLGLRYELEPAILVDNNSAGNFSPSSATGMVEQKGSPLYQADHKAFAPRAGFAWDITGKQTTVLRAGMGVSYDTPQVDDLIAHSFGAGLNVIPTGFALYNDAGPVFPPSSNPQAVKTAVITIPGGALNWQISPPGNPVFPVSLNSDLTCGTGNGPTLPDGVLPSPCTLKARGTVVSLPGGQLSMNTSNARSPMFTWTLGIQHAFRPNTSLTVNYVGTHAYNLASEININQAAPGDSVPADIQQRQPYFKQFPWFAGIFVYGPAGFSNYHALQATFVQRNFHGLTLNAAYTFSRDLATPKGGNNPYITNSKCVGCDYGLATPTQDLGVTLVYALPGRKSPAEMLEGWELSSAIDLQSGQPFSGLDGAHDLAGVNDNRGLFGGTTEQWSLYGSGRNFKNIGKLTGIPCFGLPGSGFNPALPFLNVFGCSATLPQACIDAANKEPINSSVAGSSGLAELDAIGCYMSANGKSVILPPAQGTFGNMRPGALIGAPFHEWDLSIRKSFKIRERLNLQASISAFNVLNNHAYSLGFLGGIVNVPVLFGTSHGQPNDGNPVNGTGGAREVLLGLKATF